MQVGLVPFVQTVHDRLTVEIRRGCTRGCRFCQPGMLTRPARDVDPDKVVEAVAAGMRKVPYRWEHVIMIIGSKYVHTCMIMIMYICKGREDYLDATKIPEIVKQCADMCMYERSRRFERRCLFRATLPPTRTTDRVQ